MNALSRVQARLQSADGTIAAASEDRVLLEGPAVLLCGTDFVEALPNAKSYCGAYLPWAATRMIADATGERWLLVFPSGHAWICHGMRVASKPSRLSSLLSRLGLIRELEFNKTGVEMVEFDNLKRQCIVATARQFSGYALPERPDGLLGQLRNATSWPELHALLARLR